MVPIFEGYLALGGNEVLNSARALGYTQTAPCQINWLTCPPCDGVRDAVGDGPYVIDTISSAPWYDKEDEPTHRFYGAHAILVEGIEDSTRTAGVTEGIADGGVVGQVRYGSKRIRVRAMLSARGRDALAAGFAWLDAVLRPGACGAHGDACGATDAGFFSDCPPTKDFITAPIGTLWGPIKENLMRRPRPTGEHLVGLEGTIVTEPEGPHLHAVVTEPGAQYLDWTGEDTRISVRPGRYTFQAEVRLGETTAAAVLRVLWLDEHDHFIPTGTQDGNPTMSKEWTKIAVTAEAPFGAVHVGVFLLLASDQPLGATIDVRHAMAERGGSVNTYFDGDTAAPGELQRYVWRGEPYESESLFEVGTLELGPDDILYNKVVARLQRSLHNVTCVSGPTIEETLTRGDAWGYIVEFVLVAATPWIFSNTRQIEITPSLPVVVQDIPFNLVPYPSAELAAGSVLVATNYTANPSAELNTTGWATGSTGVVAGDVAGSQVDVASGGISSVGDKAVRAKFTASNSGTAGTIRIDNASTSFPAVVAGTRMSVSVWSTIVKSGTVVVAGSQVLAIWKAGSTDVRTDVIGTVPAAGGVTALKSISPPVGATAVTVRVETTLTSWSTGAIVELYADAVAVTVP